jgi:hypothetical protein
MAIGPLLAAMAVAAQTVSAAPANPHDARAYGFGTVALAYHPSSQVYYRDIISPVSGSGVDVIGGGGLFLTRSLGVEGEVVYGGAVSTPQFTFFDENVRDVMLSGLVRYRPQDTPRLQLVTGFGMAWTRTWSDPPQPRNLPQRSAVPALTFGVDVVALETRHVGLAPSFRVRWLNRELDFGPGVGRLTYQLGAILFLR